MKRMNVVSHEKNFWRFDLNALLENSTASNLSFHVDSFNKQISLHFLFSTESHYSFELQKMEVCKEMKDDHISSD